MSNVHISCPLSLLATGEVAKVDSCLAIWDTGATGSAITPLTAKKLGLAPVGLKMVSGLGGTIQKNTYIVDIRLPNDIVIPDLSVTEIDNPVDDKGNPIDAFGLLIGMDIITRGDMTITNFEGKTVMTFRIPSLVCTDYVQEWTRKNAVANKYKRK